MLRRDDSPMHSNKKLLPRSSKQKKIFLIYIFLMADSYATPSRIVSFRSIQLFLEALLLGKAAQSPTFYGKYSESLHS